MRPDEFPVSAKIASGMIMNTILICLKEKHSITKVFTTDFNFQPGLGSLQTLWSPCEPNSPPKSSKNLGKINDLSFLLHVVSCLFRKLSSGLAWLFGPF